jgi:cytoskeletal protein CcmA (bactofilin family)
MFGKKSSDDSKSQSNLSPGSSNMTINSLVKGTHVEGSVASESDIRVDGTIKGTLNCKAKVIIGATGSIEGEIKCQNAVIEGRFKGNIHVSELLMIRETADIVGDIYTSKLTVNAGANFNGSIKMTE